MKELLLIRGLSGSGKTRLASIIDTTSHDTVTCSTDEFFTKHSATGEHYNFDAHRLDDAHKWNQGRVEVAMERGADLIMVPNTFSRNWEMAPYLTLAEKYDYTTTVITVESGLNADQLGLRNTHGVNRMTIQKMKERWEPYRKD